MPDLCAACGVKLIAYDVFVCNATLCPLCQSVDDDWPDGEDDDATVPDLGDEGGAAEILGMRLMGVRQAFNAWDAHFYPRDEEGRAAAVEWRRSVADGNLNIEENIE